jgi:hypothetical protein
MKKGESNPKSIVIALAVFSLLVVTGMMFMSGLISDYGLTTSSDMDKISLLSGDTVNVTGDMAKKPVIEDTSFISKAIDSISDTWIGKSISAIAGIYNSYSVFAGFVVTLGGILQIPDEIRTILSTILALSITFALIYFWRTGSK